MGRLQSPLACHPDTGPIEHEAFAIHRLGLIQAERRQRLKPAEAAIT